MYLDIGSDNLVIFESSQPISNVIEQFPVTVLQGFWQGAESRSYALPLYRISELLDSGLVDGEDCLLLTINRKGYLYWLDRPGIRAFQALGPWRIASPDEKLDSYTVNPETGVRWVAGYATSG